MGSAVDDDGDGEIEASVDVGEGDGEGFVVVTGGAGSVTCGCDRVTGARTGVCAVEPTGAAEPVDSVVAEDDGAPGRSVEPGGVELSGVVAVTAGAASTVVAVDDVADAGAPSTPISTTSLR